MSAVFPIPLSPARRWLRRLLFGLISLAALLALVVLALLWRSQQLRERRIELPARPGAPLNLVSDATTLARGRYLYASRGCAECHGADGTGRTVVDAGGLQVVGPNLTTGPQGVTAGYDLAQWERTLRHGVKPDGRPVLIMPSEDYAGLTDQDLTAIVAYVRQLPPKAGLPARMDWPLPLQLLYGAGIAQDAAAKIDHSQAPPQPIPASVSVAHGRYVAQMCQGCHGPLLSGGRIPGGPPDWPAAANLTPAPDGALARYPDADSFVAMLRSGRDPQGRHLQVMPFETLAALDDTDARALYAYLKTLPAQATGSR